jgi:hypothetical protein
MSLRLTMLLALMLGVLGCATGVGNEVVSPGVGENDGQLASSADESATDRWGSWLCWGVYNLEIARDGSYVHVIPDRNAMQDYWGLHVNVVKFLESEPCENCLWTSNPQVLPNGDLSIDVSLMHPFDNPTWTGFDVRGIIVFPASQYWADNELRVQAGYEPDEELRGRYSRANKGDAELVNAEGWTAIFNPSGYSGGDIFPLPDGQIFEYYQGRFASGEDLGTYNPFRRFYSNENRHMFEVGKTVTRTYIIHPPAQGPIKASYIVYAHWAPPQTTPVRDPAVDFPSIANSTLPYEFWIEQTAPFDPDEPTPFEGNSLNIRWHFKCWDTDVERATGWMTLIHDNYSHSVGLIPHPSGDPDVYYASGLSQFISDYGKIPGAFPGVWPYLFKIEIHEDCYGGDWYIANIEFEESDGIW